MPTGIYKRTECHRKKISDGLIGKKHPNGFGKDSPRWKGGRILREGYIYIHKPEHPFSGKQGYIAEHRLIVEKKIERFLRREEAIHHIDGDRTNNNIENLILCATHGSHTKLYHPEVAEKSRIANLGHIPWNKGKKNPKMIGNTNGFKKGMAPWNKGIPWSEEAKRKMSEAHKL